MNDRIVYTRADGGVSVITPSGDISTADVMAKDVPADAINPRQITVAELPQDRIFRGAWDDSNPENFIGTNLPKAKLIAHDMRRADRDEKMNPLDKEQLFASTSEGRKAEIAIEKTKILNDNEALQSQISGSTTENALRTKLKNANILAA